MNPKRQLRGRIRSDGANEVGLSGMLVTGEKLGLRDMVGQSLWRFVKRKLVLKSPGEDATRQAQEHENPGPAEMAIFDAIVQGLNRRSAAQKVS